MSFNVVNIVDLISSVGEEEIRSYAGSSHISGNKMMNFCFGILESVQKQVGGGIVFLECEDKKQLLNFYQNESNSFRVYGERFSETEKTQYIQLLRFF
jgi:acetyltransferase, GNAT family